MSRSKLQKEWEGRIAHYKASGMTQAEWCQHQDLSIHKLKYWLYKVDRPKHNDNKKPNWISLAIEDEPSSTNDLIETIQIKIGQATVEVKPDFDPTFLANVVKVLKSVC